MSLIRTQPSAVGAFEAQVFDMGKTYRTIMTQAAAQRKAQADAKKEADKTLAELANLKAAGRSQDLEYLSGIKKELTDYFSQNKDKIQPGTAEYNKYNELKTNFIYETEKSKNEKEKEARFATYASANAAKMKLSDSAKEIIEIQKLAINNPRRKEWKKKYDDGRDAGIDDLDLPDLDKFSIFDETQLQRDIKASPGATYDVKDVEFNKNFKGLNSKYPITITGTTRITDPFTVARTYISHVKKTPDTLDKYTKEFNMLTDEQKQAVTAEMNAMRDVFKAAGAADFQFEDDDTAGVTNAFEYGLFVNLKRNLPRDLGETVSTAVGNLLRPRAVGRGRTAAPKAEPLDAIMTQQIENGKVDWNYWRKEMTIYGGQASESMGIGVPPWEMIHMDNGLSTVAFRTFLKDYTINKEGDLVDDAATAAKLLPKGQVLLRDKRSGFYYYESLKNYNFRKDNPNFKATVQSAWSDMKQAQYDAGQRELLERNLKLSSQPGTLGPEGSGRK